MSGSQLARPTRALHGGDGRPTRALHGRYGRVGGFGTPYPQRSLVGLSSLFSRLLIYVPGPLSCETVHCTVAAANRGGRLLLLHLPAVLMRGAQHRRPPLPCPFTDGVCR